MDILNGMQNGPRGARAGSSGGMSPITMALLGLVAFKAFKSVTASSPAPNAPGRSAAAGPASGGLDLDSMLRGGGGQGAAGLGGILGNLGAGGLGGMLTGGLGDLLDQFKNAGKEEAATSWVGTGQNKPISAQDLSQVLTPEQIAFLTQRSGLSREELLAGLSQHLPTFVDQLTPNGRMPTADEMHRSA